MIFIGHTESSENIIKKAINIKSLHSDSLYRVNKGYKYKFKKDSIDGMGPEYEEGDAFLNWGKAVLNYSLFSEYMREKGSGMTIRTSKRKQPETDDFVVMKYEHGVGAATVNGKSKEPVSPEQLRVNDYKDGINVPRSVQAAEKKQTVHYKMLMRSPGKAKKGDCVFVKDHLYDSAINYLTMGLCKKMPEDNAKIVEMSAYSTLVTATAMHIMELSLDNIFVVKDQESTLKKYAYEVKSQKVTHYKLDLKEREVKQTVEKYINKSGFTFYKKKVKENSKLTYVESNVTAMKAAGINLDACPNIQVVERNECYVDRNNSESDITNVLWDGMGLIDKDAFPKSEDVKMSGFVYLRSHFFKSCLFKGNIQEYFKDYYKENYETETVTDMFGRKMKVTDIKVIVTDKSLKWLKFVDLMGGTNKKAFKYYKSFMKEHGNKFAVVKTAHPSKWGDLQRSSYQMNNSLPTTDETNLKNIAQTSILYCNKLKTDDESFIDYLKRTAAGRYSVNEVLIALYNWNSDFKYTEYFKEKRRKMISKLKKERLMLGKLLQYGDNLTICGNPVGLLKEVIGEGYESEGCFHSYDDRIQCYTSRFNAGECLAAFRSPHNSPNNIIYLENVYPEQILKYFPGIGNNVIVVNGIKTDIQSRANGMDMDTDSFYVTNQRNIVELAKIAYKNYPTIVSRIIETGNSEYSNTKESYAKMDNNIAAAQTDIGFSSNIAQLALSYYCHDGMDNQELEDIFIICSVLAQIAIDSSKRNFDINVSNELRRIQNLECMKKYDKVPRFFAEAQNKKNRDKPKYKEEDIDDFNCPMDILYRIINKGVINLQEHKELNTPTIENTTILDKSKRAKVTCDRKQRLKIESIIQDYNQVIEQLNPNDKDYQEVMMREFDAVSLRIKNLTINQATMYELVENAFKTGGKYCDKVLALLYDKTTNENGGNCTKLLEIFVKNPQKN